VVPDRDHGYCLDDNVRALMLFAGLDAGPEADRQRLRFASFVQYAWNEEQGAFRNFMGYDRCWLEDRGSDDSNGRAIWALGHCAAEAGDDALRRWARDWFERAAEGFAGVASPRAVAFAMLGAGALLGRVPGHAGASALLDRGGGLLMRLAGAYADEQWTWFEPVLAYDNARLPQALIVAGDALGRSEWTRTGLAALDWLCARQTASSGCFRPVGSDGFGRVGERLPFDRRVRRRVRCDAGGGVARPGGDGVALVSRRQ
jgi:hypothetical protein